MKGFLCNRQQDTDEALLATLRSSFVSLWSVEIFRITRKLLNLCCDCKETSSRDLFGLAVGGYGCVLSTKHERTVNSDQPSKPCKGQVSYHKVQPCEKYQQPKMQSPEGETDV